MVVLCILWEIEKPLIASDITKIAILKQQYRPSGAQKANKKKIME
jgi:hypothetical protein